MTLEEIKSQIALEHGKAITVNVRRADDVVLRKFHSFFYSTYTCFAVAKAYSSVWQLSLSVPFQAILIRRLF